MVSFNSIPTDAAYPGYVQIHLAGQRNEEIHIWRREINKIKEQNLMTLCKID